MKIYTGLEIYKDILYLIGSVLGIVGFFRTLKRRDLCEFNYRTEFGDEVRPFLVCIRGDIFNLELTGNSKSIIAKKYPPGTLLSKVKYQQVKYEDIDESAFFAILREGEVLGLNNEKFSLPKVILKFEDQYHNKYYQTFEFNEDEIDDEERMKRKYRSCYKISKRHWKFLWIWFPWFNKLKRNRL